MALSAILSWKTQVEDYWYSYLNSNIDKNRHQNSIYVLKSVIMVVKRISPKFFMSAVNICSIYARLREDVSRLEPHKTIFQLFNKNAHGL